jgi:spore coat polysaccharide biosynthesis protein SpsF
MNAVAIVQARMGSTRLPGKVLLPLAGTTVLGCVVERLSRCGSLHGIVIATSELVEDDPVVEEAERLGIPSARGDASDVLARYCDAARLCGADPVVRITSDCPLIDPVVVDAVVAAFAAGGCDYASNTLERTDPRGVDAEVVCLEAVERARRDAAESYEREHVTPHLYRHPEAFRIRSYRNPDGTDRSSLRWTLDTPDDYAFVRAAYAACAHRRPSDVRTADLLAAIARTPELTAINASVPQKELGT